MIRGLYTAASGMLAQQRRHDAITNNIANMLTPGYKQDTAALRSFPEMLIHLMGPDARSGQPAPQIGTLYTGVYMDELLPSFTQGDLTETKKPGDLALISNIGVQYNGQQVAFDQSGKAVIDGQVIYQPQAFFTVLGADGERRYTRDGRFHLSETGQLLSVNGEPVLGVDGEPIEVAGLTLDQIRITENGTLVVQTEAGVQVLGQLLISRVDNPYELIREGNGNYRLSEGAAQPVAVTAEDQVAVRQGYLERSNVDAAQSLVDMMTALRLYEANQKVIQAFDQTLDKAVNEIGRV